MKRSLGRIMASLTALLMAFGISVAVAAPANAWSLFYNKWTRVSGPHIVGVYSNSKCWFADRYRVDTYTNIGNFYVDTDYRYGGRWIGYCA